MKYIMNLSISFSTDECTSQPHTLSLRTTGESHDALAFHFSTCTHLTVDAHSLEWEQYSPGLHSASSKIKSYDEGLLIPSLPMGSATASSAVDNIEWRGATPCEGDVMKEPCVMNSGHL